MEIFLTESKSAPHLICTVFWRTLITKKGNRLLTWQPFTSPCMTPCTWRVRAEKSSCIKKHIHGKLTGREKCGRQHKEGAQVQSGVHHLPARALHANDHFGDSPFKGRFGTLFASSQKQVQNLLAAMLTHPIGQLTWHANVIKTVKPTRQVSERLLSRWAGLPQHNHHKHIYFCIRADAQYFTLQVLLLYSLRETQLYFLLLASAYYCIH